MENEHRTYFRLTDQLGLRLTALSEKKYQSLQLSQQYASTPRLDRVSQMDFQIQMVLDKIGIKNPDVGELGKLLNQKLNYLMDHSDLGKVKREIEEIPVYEVDISASGLACNHAERLALESKLAIELVLPPKGQYLKLLARVVSCELLDDPAISRGYRLGVAFIDTSEAVKEYLIQHLVQRQGALIKAEREANLLGR